MKSPFDAQSDLAFLAHDLKTDWRISSATQADVEEIDRIEREAFSNPWRSDLIRGALLNARYEVRVLRIPPDPVVGFYIAHTIRELSNLDNLAVDGQARGRGLGGKLILDWIGRAQRRRMAMLSLQVNTGNREAQKLYQDFDFQVTRLLVGYYPNGEDAYQMETTLPASRIERGIPC